MRPRTLDEVIGQRHLLGPGTPLRRLVESEAPMSLFLWGPPGTGKTTLAYVVVQRHQAPLRRDLRGLGGRQGRPRRHRHRPARARHDRPPDRAVRRRGPPLQQGPAGRPAARRGEPLGHLHRRHHREPVLLRHLPAAVALAAAHAGVADRRRHPRGPGARGRRRARPRRARHARPRGRSTTSSGWPAATPAASLTYLEAAALLAGRHHGRGGGEGRRQGGRPLRPAGRPALRRDQRASSRACAAPTPTPRCTTSPA